MKDVKVLSFVCNWCSYGGADQAGSQRAGYPVGVRLVRVMCSGRVDPQMVMEAYKSGADGVMVLGCHPGDCHYREGNFNAQKRMTLLRNMLDQFGIERERFRIDWVSAGEGTRFSRIVTDMYEAVASLGPLKVVSNTPREVSA